MSATLGDAFVRVRPDTRTFAPELSAKTSSAFGQVAKRGALIVGGGLTAAIAVFTKSATQLEAEFGKTMNQMQAAAGVPQAGMRDLSKLALQMGADTVFSANDAASAMLELAKNGLKPATIEAGALKSALTLAAAGGVDMERAATVMGNALNTFRLRGDQASEVAAALAGAANASSASIDSLAQGLAQVGQSAQDSGLSIQETAAALAAMEQAGVKGSDAGTSVKTFLARLVPQTKAAQKGFNYLHLGFTKANGDFKSLAAISQTLQDKFAGMSQAERTVAFNTLFGSDARRAATVLMNEGASGIRKYIKATSDQNAAERQAQAAMKGTAGAIERRKGAVETATLAFGKAIKPVTIFVNNLIAELAGGAIPIIDQFGKMIRGLGKVDLSSVGDSLRHLDLKSAFGSIDWSGTSSGLSSIGKSLKDVDWSKFGDAFSEGTSDTISVFAVAIGFAADHVNLLAKAMPYLVTGLIAYKVAQAAGNAVAVLGVPTKIAEVVVNRQLVKSNRELLASRSQLTVATVTGTAAENTGILTRIRGTVATIASAVAQKTAAAASKAWAATQWLLNAALTANPIGLVVLAIAGLVAGIVIAWKKSETFRKVVTGAFNKVKAVGAAVFGKIGDLARSSMDFIRRAWSVVQSVLTAPFHYAAAFIGNVWDKIQAGAAASKDWVVRKFTDLVGWVRSLPGKITSAVGDLGSLLLNAGQQVASGLWEGLKSMAGWLKDKVWDWVKDVLPGPIEKALGISSPSKVAHQQGVWFGKGLADGVRSTGDVVARSAEQTAQKAVDALKKRLESAQGLFSSLGDKFTSISSGVRDAFMPDLLSSASVSDFFTAGTGAIDQLKSLSAARKKLLGMGGSRSFITQLFQSGNSSLIQELAGGSRGQLADAQSLFGQTNKWSKYLGDSVAWNSSSGSQILGDRMNDVRDEIRGLRKDLREANKRLNGGQGKNGDGTGHNGRATVVQHIHDKSGDPRKTARESARHFAFAGGG